MVRWSWRMNFFPKKRPMGKISGVAQRKIFHAARTSMRQWLSVIGVTVVSVENQASPQRTTSYRRFGSTKSIVVSILSPAFAPDKRINLYGALLAEGACALMRKPLG